MSGASLEHSLDEFGAYLAGLQKRLADLTPLMEEIGAGLETSGSRRFETKQAPDGAPWAALAASTIKQRIKKGYSPGDVLLRRGALRNSLHSQAGPDSVIISLGGTGDSTAYAAIHQFGGQAGRNRRVKIPARPVLGLSPEDEAGIAAMAESFLTGPIALDARA